MITLKFKHKRWRQEDTEFEAKTLPQKQKNKTKPRTLQLWWARTDLFST
jgi:hypothetical protein